MENNQAFCAVLDDLQPIEGADNIISASVMLKGIKVTQVVVGKDTKPGTRVVYFDSNLCIEPEVIAYLDKLSPDYGKEGFKSMGVYLGKNGRVRVVKLRGCISNGLIIEKDKISYFTKNEVLEDGFSFTALGTTQICHKYAPSAKAVYTQNRKGKTIKHRSRMIPEQFHFHIDTLQLMRNLDKVYPHQVVSISRKIHGTSAIVSNCLVRRKLTLKDKVAKFFKVPVNETEHDYIYASRSVVKNDAKTTGFYKVDLWTKVGEDTFKGKLHEGETVYYEIVGYIPSTSSMIQKNYTYGCEVGKCKIAVYRTTSTATDGSIVEYGWQAIKERCKELNVPMVQEYFYGRLDDWLLSTNHVILNSDPSNEGELTKWRTELLGALKETYLEKDCTDCIKKVPDEGIVIRVEGLGIEVYKLKSEKFFLNESKEAEEGVANVDDTQDA